MIEQLLVKSPAHDVYLVHRVLQHPVEGVAVYRYPQLDAWVCEADYRPPGSTLTPCEHVQSAKRFKEQQ